MSKVILSFRFYSRWNFQPDDATGSIALDRDEAKSTSSASVLESHPENDIGALFQNPSPEECQKVVDELTDGEKYSLLNPIQAGFLGAPAGRGGGGGAQSIVKQTWFPWKPW